MALAFDANTNFSVVNSSSSTFSHTITGTNPVLLVGVSCESRTVSTITYNGVAMTLAAGPPASPLNNVYIYYLVAPPTGTNSVAVTYSSFAYGEVTAISLTGADQSSPIDVTNKAHILATTSPSTSITTTVANDWIVDYITDNSNSTVTVNAAQTQRTNIVADNRIVCMSTRAVTTAGAYSMSWTSNFNDQYDHVLVAVKESTSGGGAVSHNLSLLGVGQ
jgi:hypothetical protein